MMVDKAVSTNDNNFNEYSRAYKYDAVISTLIENKILSIKKECKENSTSKRKRRKSSRKISFSRKFFVSCRSKRSSVGSGSGSNNVNDDVAASDKILSIAPPSNVDNDAANDVDAAAERTDLQSYDYDNGTASGTIENLSKTTTCQIFSKTSSSIIASPCGAATTDDTNADIAIDLTQPSGSLNICSSHDGTDLNLSLQNEQSTSKSLLLKDLSSTSSTVAFPHHHHQHQHCHQHTHSHHSHRKHASLSSSTSSSVSAPGRYDRNIVVRVIDTKRMKQNDGDDGSGAVIDVVSSSDSVVDLSRNAIVEPKISGIDVVTRNDIIDCNDKTCKYHLKQTNKKLIPDGLVASIKHSFHSLALYNNQYRNTRNTNNEMQAADVENNFLYEAKSISAPTSPTMLYPPCNIIRSQTMMISSENVKSQVSYIRNSIHCPNYNMNNTNDNNIENDKYIDYSKLYKTNINNKKKLKTSLCEIFSQRSICEADTNITIVRVPHLPHDDSVNTTAISMAATAAPTVNANNNNNNSSSCEINLNSNKYVDSNSTVIDINDDTINSNRFVENRLDSVAVATTTPSPPPQLPQTLKSKPTELKIIKKCQIPKNDSSLNYLQNEYSNQFNLNSESVINKKRSEIISIKKAPQSVKGRRLSTNTISTRVTSGDLIDDRNQSDECATFVKAKAIQQLQHEELLPNFLIHQNLSNYTSILPSSMTASNLMSITSCLTNQTAQTQSTTMASKAAADATKSYDRNAFISSGSSRIINGRYVHSGSDDEYRRNKRKYKRYHRCSDPVLVYPSTSGLQHCILSMPPNQIQFSNLSQIQCNEDFVYDLTYQADQNINDDKESIIPEPNKKSRHHKHKKKHRHRHKPKILVHDLDTHSVKVIDPDDLPQRARWTIIATACLLLLMCLMLVGITLRMAPIIDDIVRQENERLMQESMNRAMLAKNYTESNF